MTKIKCLTLNATVPTNNYRTAKGNVHEFHQKTYTEIADPEDALYFLNSCGGNSFEAEGDTVKVKKELEEKVVKIKKESEKKKKKEEKKDKDEEAKSKEDDGHISDTDGKGTEDVRGDSVSDDSTEDVKDKDEEAKEDEGSYLLSKDEAFALTKDEQVELIKKLDGEDTKIPKYERDRVDKILKLQKGGSE